MLTDIRLAVAAASTADALPTLGDIMPDDAGYVAFDSDGFAYFGATRRAVWREYEDGLHRLMHAAKSSGYSLAELRQHRRMEHCAQETREAGRM
jgi:hypothetical protein